MSDNLAITHGGIGRFCGSVPGRGPAAGAGAHLRIYAIVQERTCRVYMLFGRCGVLTSRACTSCPEAGSLRAGGQLLGSCYVLDLRLDQEYLRSQPVNSEEGAPNGNRHLVRDVIADPVAFPVQLTRPRGSLRPTYSNATVRCLSNMPLRRCCDPPQHEPDGAAGGHRKVAGVGLPAWVGVLSARLHFRDAGMIKQIEESSQQAAAGDLRDQQRAPTRSA